MFMAAREESGDAAGEAESKHFVFQPLRLRHMRASAAGEGQGEGGAGVGAPVHAHRDPITFVGHVPRIDSYVTAAQDGASPSPSLSVDWSSGAPT